MRRQEFCQIVNAIWIYRREKRELAEAFKLTQMLEASKIKLVTIGVQNQSFQPLGKV
jgi:hypothetical protein